MSRLSHAIVYDTDTKGLEALAYGFEIDGVKVTSSAQSAQVRSHITASTGEVVIAVMRDEDADGIQFVRGLAEDSATQKVPRLLLASAGLPDQVAGLAGPSKFLPLPAFVRDVVTAAKLLAGGAADGEEKSFEAALSEIGLFFTVRTMVGLGLSGIVEVERGQRKGELRFHEGEVVSAQVGPLEGPPALHQLLLWEEAAMVVQFRPTVRRGQTFTQGDELLEDCARFLRDFEHATRSIGHAQSLFVQDAEQTAALVDSFPQELLPIQRLFDGNRNLGDAIEDSPFRVFDTIRAVERLVELGTIRRKAIEKPSTGLPGARRTREDWLGRSAELTAGTARPAASAAPSEAPVAKTPSAPAPVSAATESVSMPVRGRRSFRRKTGEHAIAAAPAPNRTGGERSATSDATKATVTTSLVQPPASAASPTPVPSATTASAEASAPPTPAPDPAAPVEVPTSGKPGRTTSGGILQARGELRASTPERAPRAVIEEEPSMLINLGPEISAEVPVVAAPPTAPATIVPVVGPGPVFGNTLTGQQPSDLAAPAPPGAPAAAEVPPPARTAGVQVAELDTGMRPRPPAEQLEAPPTGPSIMIDPGFVQEMDAFELAHTAATPPPVLVTPPPAAAPPAASPAAAAAPAPAPAPAPPANKPDEAVVSFVRGVATARPPRSAAAFNAAPTIPVGAVNLGAAAGAKSPPNLDDPAANVVTPPPVRTDAPVEAKPATPPAAEAAPHPHERIPERRASGEFDALEADFFAREAELYKKDTLENFEDLDHNKGKNGRNGTR
ncbi:MAG TPA: hypothetical protein VGG33_27775 [Polyangia bacterium]